MNNIINAGTMTSREIANITGKQHGHVKRDIEKMLLELEIGASKFGYTYLDSQNKEQEEYVLPKRETLILTSGYSIKQRASIIDRWHDLEQSKALPKNLSRMDILQMAIDSEKENLELRHEVEELKPKADFHDQVTKAEDAISVGAAAKVIGTGRNRLLSFMRRVKWVTRKNEPYQEKIESGHMDVKLGEWEHPQQGLQRTVTALVTGKGLTKLQSIYGKSLLN